MSIVTQTPSFRFTFNALDMNQAVSDLVDSKTGGVATFWGVIRDEENGSPISGIEFDFYEGMANKEMRLLMERAETRFGARALVHHRLGFVPVGEASLLVVCAGVHRKEAFEACAYLVDQIKKIIPIWKVTYKWIQ